MVWAGVSLHHKAKIVFINENLTAACYQHEVLDTGSFHYLETTEECSASSPSGKGHHCKSECKQRKCHRLPPPPPPPPKSPNLNIIENVKDELNRCVKITGAIPTTLNQLSKNSLRLEQASSE